MTAKTRKCEVETCNRRVRRKAKTGPWPRWCARHKLEHEQELRRTVYAKPRKYTAPVTCADCLVTIEIPAHGKPPQRCEACTAERKRQQNAERQRRFRQRKAA
jgi:hypothetical protein